MGKNQQHKASQMSRHSTGGGGDPADAAASADGVDVSFHSAAWHEARLAALTVERPSYEEWKQRQKDAEARDAEAQEAQDQLMREYREGLAADRAARMGLKDGGVSKDPKSKKSKKDKKEKSSKHRKSKDKDKKSKSKKKRRRRSSSSDGSSGSESPPSADDAPASGPVKLSEFFKS